MNRTEAGVGPEKERVVLSFWHTRTWGWLLLLFLSKPFYAPLTLIVNEKDKCIIQLYFWERQIYYSIILCFRQTNVDLVHRNNKKFISLKNTTTPFSSLQVFEFGWTLSGFILSKFKEEMKLAFWERQKYYIYNDNLMSVWEREREDRVCGVGLWDRDCPFIIMLTSPLPFTHLLVKHLSPLRIFHHVTLLFFLFFSFSLPPMMLITKNARTILQQNAPFSNLKLLSARLGSILCLTRYGSLPLLHSQPHYSHFQHHNIMQNSNAFSVCITAKIYIYK